ncbi:hypothetical protein J437_LFUL004299 [Ladona fulva]|uniref:Uncharacterized protein n=1 Tax=Ladona fulva TaxID=123851 RepID=A0A8K0NWJ9_LADFU|nr:hypothetical protein J437_LFUL004299 [Ladona fulva]
MVKDSDRNRFVADRGMSLSTPEILVASKGIIINKQAQIYVDRNANNMSIKVHFLHSHLANFQKDTGVVSDEQGEQFCQDLNVMQACYQVVCSHHK